MANVHVNAYPVSTMNTPDLPHSLNIFLGLDFN